MRIKIEVTQEDINNGVRQDAEKCPIACALKRIAENPEVSDNIEFNLDGIRYFSKLTDNAAQFISDFDGQKDVQPFNFEIEAKEKDYEDYV